MLLIEKDVWNVITESAPNPITASWKEAEKKAHLAIALSVEDDQIQHVRNCTTAKDAWNKLKISMKKIHRITECKFYGN